MSDKRMRILIAAAAGLALATVLWVGVRAGTFAAAQPLGPPSEADAVYPLSFQGRLTRNGQSVVTPVSVTFSIYDAKVGATAIFSEVQTIDPDENGLFNTALHVNPPLGVSTLTNVWIGVKVGSDPEMLPRIQMTGVSYAFTLVPGAGIRGSLYMTDSTNAILSGINLADGVGVRGYSVDGTGVYADSDTGYALEADGNVHVTGQYTGTFPSPAYDSGWQAASAGSVITLSHALGGDPDFYVVDMRCRDLDNGYGDNQVFYGGAQIGANFQGANWQNLTGLSIQVLRRADDVFCDNVRVRIWAYK